MIITVQLGLIVGIDANSKIIEARAWVRKYLIEASFSWFEFEWSINGIKE